MDSLYKITNHAGSNVHSLLSFGARKIGSTLQKVSLYRNSFSTWDRWEAERTDITIQRVVVWRLQSGFILFWKIRQTDRYTGRNLISASFNSKFKNIYLQKKTCYHKDKMNWSMKIAYDMPFNFTNQPFLKHASFWFWPLQRLRRNSQTVMPYESPLQVFWIPIRAPWALFNL